MSDDRNINRHKKTMTCHPYDGHGFFICPDIDEVTYIPPVSQHQMFIELL